mmetsp:Transcript_30715/g.95486  ORF Transcript_30715/g.95486 Transcript_30715/m.95486 type:complete len:280 (+) Transcript_30715:345-1184(+)
MTVATTADDGVIPTNLPDLPRVLVCPMLVAHGDGSDDASRRQCRGRRRGERCGPRCWVRRGQRRGQRRGVGRGPRRGGGRGVRRGVKRGVRRWVGRVGGRWEGRRRGEGLWGDDDGSLPPYAGAALLGVANHEVASIPAVPIRVAALEHVRHALGQAARVWPDAPVIVAALTHGEATRELLDHPGILARVLLVVHGDGLDGAVIKRGVGRGVGGHGVVGGRGRRIGRGGQGHGGEGRCWPRPGRLGTGHGGEGRGGPGVGGYCLLCMVTVLMAQSSSVG